MIGTEPVELRALVERLDNLAARRLASRPRTRRGSRPRPPARRPPARPHQGPGRVAGRAARRAARWPDRCRQEHDLQHARRPRGSPTGVLRPTTRVAVVLVHPDDRQALVDGAFGAIPPGHLQFVEDSALERGLAVVDAPDIDSLEHANRVLADQLVEAADLCCFVTTATRYADRVPWAVLARVQERGLPLWSSSTGCRRIRATGPDVLADVGRLIADAGLEPCWRRAPDAPPRDLIAVREGDLATDGDRLAPARSNPSMTRSPVCAPVASSPRARLARPDRVAPGARRQPGPDRRRRRARGDRRRGVAPHCRSRVRSPGCSACRTRSAMAASCARRRSGTGRRTSAPIR